MLGKFAPLPIGHGGDPVREPISTTSSTVCRLVHSSTAVEHVGPLAVALDEQRFVVGQVRAPDHVEEGVPLGGGDGGDPHVAVEARLDARAP